MKAADLIFAALLAVSTALQFNDPDPTYWIAVYGLGAVVAVLSALGKRTPFLAALTIGMVISGMIYATPGFVEYLQSGNYASITGSMDGPARYVEPAREFLGLSMALAMVGSITLRWRQS